MSYSSYSTTSKGTGLGFQHNASKAQVSASMIEERLRYKLWRARRRLFRLNVGTTDVHLDIERLRLSNFFSRWPTAGLESICNKMVLEAYDKGEVLAYGEEPRVISSLFWIVAGRISEVISKHEIREGACVVSSVGGAGGGPSSKSYVGEQYKDTMGSDFVNFGAGKFAPANYLFLNANYRRTMRCESSVLAFRIPFSTVMLIQRECGAPLEATVSAAKENEQARMLERNEKPTMQCVLSENPLLTNLENATLNIVWMALSPLVVCSGEHLCDDVFSSETIYVLQSGCIKVGHDIFGSPSHVTNSGSFFGLHSFMPTDMASSLGERRPAVAVGVSLLWSIPLKMLLQIVSVGEWKACAKTAYQLMRSTVNSVVLRRIPAFSVFDDGTLSQLAKLLGLRAVCHKECLLVGGKVPEIGVIVVSGVCCFTNDGCGNQPLAGNRAGKTVTRGNSVGFEECISGKKFRYGLIAAVNSVVLFLERSIILEALGNKDGFLKQYANRSVQHASFSLYDPSGVSLSKEIASGPIPTREDLSGKEPKDNVRPRKLINFDDNSSGADLDHIVQQNTRVLSTLFARLSDLNPSCRGSETGISDYDIASHLVFRNSRREEKGGRYRAESCFTIDEEGRVKFCGNGVVSHEPKVTTRVAEDAKKGVAKECSRTEVILAIYEAVKREPRERVNLNPPAGALRCPPTSGLAAVVGQCPASHRVLALRREMKTLGEKVDKASVLPLNCVLPTSKLRSATCRFP